MEITIFSASIFISCLFYAILVQSQDNLFETFTKDVQKNLPTNDFLKLFKLNHDSVDQVMQALTKAGSAFAATLETSVPEDIVQEFKNKAEKFSKLTPEQFFEVYAKALSGTLGDQGILYSGNVKDIANTYVDKLKDAANSLDDENILDAVPAVAKASAKVLKENHLSGLQLILRNFANNLLSQIDMAN